MKPVILAVAAILAAAPALAQHKHAHKGPNGGEMEDVAGVHIELLVKDKSLTFNVYDEANKPLPTMGFTGSVLVTAGGAKEALKLAPVGEALKGDAKQPVPADAVVTVTIKTAAGKSGQAVFKPHNDH